MWTTGAFTVSHTVALDWTKRYLVTGYLTQTDGDDYAHVYIATLCTYHGDVIRCGVRDNPDDQGSNIVEFIDHAVSVTLKLRTTGGRHRAEGVIYEY
jgi:hypothetical protein